MRIFYRFKMRKMYMLNASHKLKCYKKSKCAFDVRTCRQRWRVYVCEFLSTFAWSQLKNAINNHSRCDERYNYPACLYQGAIQYDVRDAHLTNLSRKLYGLTVLSRGATSQITTQWRNLTTLRHDSYLKIIIESSYCPLVRT